MTIRRAVALVACEALLGASRAVRAEAQSARLHTVQRILLDGKAVESAAGVTLRARDGKVENTLRRGAQISDGTRIDVPAHVVVLIASSGAKSTATLERQSSASFPVHWTSCACNRAKRSPLRFTGRNSRSMQPRAA